MYQNDHTYNKESPLFPRGRIMELSNKSNLVLYLDKELIKKSKDLGFNLSRTFENHLKHLITQFSCIKTENAVDSKGEINRKWAEPELNRRPLARKANVLIKIAKAHEIYPILYSQQFENLQFEHLLVLP